MVQRFNQNHEVLKIMAGEGSVKNEILCNSRKWSILKELELVLSDFYHATLFLENEKSYLSQVIPTVNLLLNCVSKKIENEFHEIESFKKDLKNSLKLRFLGYEENELYAITTILDPRFKTFGIKDKKIQKSMLKKLENILDKDFEISNGTIIELKEAGLDTQKIRITEMFDELRYSEELKMRNKFIKNQVRSNILKILPIFKKYFSIGNLRISQ